MVLPSLALTQSTLQYALLVSQGYVGLDLAVVLEDGLWSDIDATSTIVPSHLQRLVRRGAVSSEVGTEWIDQRLWRRGHATVGDPR